jgi:hypothetical protein
VRKPQPRYALTQRGRKALLACVVHLEKLLPAARGRISSRATDHEGICHGRFVMIKPSIVYFAFPAAMLWRCWIGRYLPPIVASGPPPRKRRFRSA